MRIGLVVLLCNPIFFFCTYSIGELKVVLVTKPEKGVSYLHICNLPGLKPTYTLQLSGPTTLAACLPFQVLYFKILLQLCVN